ncbi:hypothetical protein K9L05_02000, partial [Candidatus Babeliales bacterium]|nr:hypothetical protein [Candidatus Babeliales bacterium]
MILNLVTENLKRLFFPTFCRSCNQLADQDAIFCCNCFRKIKSIVSSYLAVNKNKSIKIFSVSDYQDPLRSLVLKKTFSDILASKQLAQLILKRTPIKNLDIDFIVPIPLHWSRYIKRGYNQSYVMAKYLSKNTEIPVLNILKRNRKTIFQSKLSFKDRQENLKNAFIIKTKYKDVLK